MNDYNKDWLKNRGFFEREKREILNNKEIFIDLDNNIAYLEVKNNDELENLKRLVIKNYPKTLYIWFYFPEEKKIKVFRRHGIELMWFWFKPEMNEESLKSRMDKLNKLSPSNIDVLFDTRDIADKFYLQLFKIMIKLAKNIKEVKEDYNRLMVVQHFIDRLIFFYFISQMGLIRIKYENKEIKLSRKQTREFISWLKNNLSDIELYEFFSELFFEVLGKVSESGWSHKKVKIRNYEFEIVAPSLNGGLFVENEIENKKEREIKIRGIGELIDILNKYNWIIGEEIPEEEDVIGELTPEIIGHIYEKFVVSLGEIDIRKLKLDEFQQMKEELRYGRKKIGAYYTPEEITSYISKNTIFPYLRDKMKEKFGEKGEKLISDENSNIFNRDDFDKDEIEMIKYLYFDVLSKIKILDNACGSGSFLIAAGKILLKLYSRIIKILERNAKNDERVLNLINEIRKSPNRNYYIVRQIITNNLYGVDIMDGAIEIAKLRFWLWLVSQVDPNEIENKKIETLPNLDFNLVPGNSLIGFVDIEEVDMPIEIERKGRKTRWTSLKEKYYPLTEFGPKGKISKISWLKELAEKKKKFKTIPIQEAMKIKENIRKDLENGKEILNRKFYEIIKSKGIDISWEEFLDLKPFHWGFEFYEVFDLEKPKEQRGFDIIIGNPPYGNIFKSKQLELIELFYFSSSSKDASAIFLERSFRHLNKNGKLGMIIPLNIARIEKFYDIRKFLIDVAHTYMIVDVGNPFAGDVELEMIIIFYDLLPRSSFITKSFKPVPINKKEVPYSIIRTYDYRFIIYWDDIYEWILKNSILNWVEVSQGIPRKADYTLNGKYICISANAIDRYTIKKDKIQMKRRVTDKFIKENGIENQLEEIIITPFSLGKTGKVTDLALECVIKPKNYVPDGTTVVISLKDDILDKKTALLILNSYLINYLTCRYILSYGVRIFRNYLFQMLPLRIPKNKNPFILLCDYMLFLNESKDRRITEQKTIEFLDKQLIDSLVYELYFKEKFEEDGLKTNLIELVEPYLEDIEKLKSDDEKLNTIRKVVEKIKNDEKVMKEIEKIKNHKWVKIIEGRN